MSDDHAKHDDKHEEHGGGHGGGGHGHGGGHGGHEEHEEGVPEWMVSFADNALLQMGFFVILLALNLGAKAQGPVSEGDGTSGQKSSDNSWLDFQIAMREAFNNPVDLGSTSENDLPLIKRLLEKAQEQNRTGQSTDKGISGEDKNAQSIRQSTFLDPASRVDFDEKSSELSPTAKKTLAAFAKENAGGTWMIEVRGHTSALETYKDIARSRSLSYERAFAAAQGLVAEGIPWARIRLSAAGDVEPASAQRARSSSAHAGNQRVEIFVLSDTMPADPFSKPDASGSPADAAPAGE